MTAIFLSAAGRVAWLGAAALMGEAGSRWTGGCSSIIALDDGVGEWFMV